MNKLIYVPGKHHKPSMIAHFQLMRIDESTCTDASVQNHFSRTDNSLGQTMSKVFRCYLEFFQFAKISLTFAPSMFIPDQRGE